jgi:ribosomal protein L27
VGRGRDDTLFALREGVVRYEMKRGRRVAAIYALASEAV